MTMLLCSNTVGDISAAINMVWGRAVPESRAATNAPMAGGSAVACADLALCAAESASIAAGSASLKVVVSAAVPLFAAGHVAMIVEKMPLLHLAQAIMPQGPRAGNFNQFSLQLRTWVELKILCSYQRLHRVSKEKHVLSMTLA